MPPPSAATGPPRPATPAWRSAFAGRSASPSPPGCCCPRGPRPPTASDPSMELGFRWEEREPFAARVLLPRRLAALDDDAGSLLAQPLRGLLDRHRAAGVEVRVEYADPRWQLGTGVVRDEAGDPLGVVVSGTELWPDGSPQPTGRTLRTLRPRSR